MNNVERTRKVGGDVDEAEKILRQDILEVLRMSGEAELANPRLFVSSLLDIDAGRTREARVLADNCTDQLLGIFSSAGRDAQALNQASSKAKSYLTNDRLLREDVSAAIADAFEDALCRYYGIALVKRTQTSQPQPEPQPKPQSQPQPEPIPQPQPQPQSRTQPQPQPQPKVTPPSQSTVPQASASQTKSTDGNKPADNNSTRHTVAWAITIAFSVINVAGRIGEMPSLFAKGDYSFFAQFVLAIALLGAFSYGVGLITEEALQMIAKGKISERIAGLIGVLVSLGIPSYLTYMDWAKLTAEGVSKQPFYYAQKFVFYAVIAALAEVFILFVGGLLIQLVADLIGAVIGLFIGLFSPKSRK